MDDTPSISSSLHHHPLQPHQQQYSSSNSSLECPCTKLLFPPLLLVVPTIALKLQVSIILNSLNGSSSSDSRNHTSPKIVAKLLSSQILEDAEAWKDIDLIITCPEGLFLYQNEIKSILCHTSFPISYIDEMHLLWSAKDFRHSMEFVRGFLRSCSSKLVEMTGTFDPVMLSPSFSPSIVKGSSDMITSLSTAPAPPIYKATTSTTTSAAATTNPDNFISFVKTNILQPLLLLHYSSSADGADHEESRGDLSASNTIWEKIQILVYCRTIAQVNQLSLLIQNMVSEMFGSTSLYKPQHQSLSSSSTLSSSTCRTSTMAAAAATAAPTSSSLPSIAVTSIHSECNSSNYDCLKDILEKQVTSYFIIGSSSIVQSCDLPSLSYLIVYDCPFSIVDLFQLFGRATRLGKPISTIVLFKGSSYLLDNLSWNNVDGHLLSDSSSCLLLYSSIYSSVPSFPSSSSMLLLASSSSSLTAPTPALPANTVVAAHYHHPHHKPFGSLPSLLKSHLSFQNDMIAMQHQINLETQRVMKDLGKTCFMSFSNSKHPPHKSDLKECPNYSKFTVKDGPNQQCYRCKAFIGYVSRGFHSKYCLGAKHHMILSSSMQQCSKCGLENNACPTHPPSSSSSSSSTSSSSLEYFSNLKRDIHEVILLSAIAYSSLEVVPSSSSSPQTLLKPIPCCSNTTLSSPISQKILSNDAMLKEHIYSLFHTPASISPTALPTFTPQFVSGEESSSSSSSSSNTQMQTYILLHKSDFSLLALHNWEDIKDKVYKVIDRNNPS